MSILHSTHAVFLRFHNVTETTQISFRLCIPLEALFYRSLKYEQPNDVTYCIKYFHFLRDPSLEAFGITRNAVTASLVTTGHSDQTRVYQWQCDAEH